ncbi:hypothetical protein KP509_23G003000 [Ceratopteris richardii]|uniref:MMS19 nucleotide excision repair protein n=1 Tax=Ceratopteris richardii TaxID=49495 RepID=A0A8T2RWZ7_CERRI|nr:hypothetical protein KP509_23G003000 [Ceratopteris richardii]
MDGTPLSSSWLVHLRAYVNTDLPSSHQIEGRDAIAELISKNALSLPRLVSEMGDILTSTDAVMRARGILLLGELWMHFVAKPFDATILHHFAAFFAARLEDWHSLHGALIGSLALLKREKHVGVVDNDDAKALLKSALENVEVQALVQEDRMFCLEFFECLLVGYPEAISSHGTLFVERLCGIIDGEKDPRCLLLGFHIVELAAQIFPDPAGYIGSVIEDLFDLLSCYFPISFTPPPDDNWGITREDLSVALMHCLGATNLFAEFSIPFLLDKLSSSLKNAKLDSLKFLGFCVSRYGAEELRNHSTAIWMALKQELFSSYKVEEAISKERDNQTFHEALNCLQACLKLQAGNKDDMLSLERNSLLELVVEDPFINDFFDCISGHLIQTSARVTVCSTGNGDIALERALTTIKETGLILTMAAKASPASCFAVTHRIFPNLFNLLRPGICIKGSDDEKKFEGIPVKSSLWFPDDVLLTVLEVIRLIIEGVKGLADSVLKLQGTYSDVKWIGPLQLNSEDLLMSFIAITVSGLQNRMDIDAILIDRTWNVGVAGLQAVGSFPPQLSILSRVQYDYLFSFLKYITLSKSEATSLWNRTVDAIRVICTAEEHFSCQGLKALSVLCTGGAEILTNSTRKLTELLCEDLKKFVRIASEEDNTVKRILPLSQGLLDYILPCCMKVDMDVEVLLGLAVNLWHIVENFPEDGLLKDSRDNIQVLQNCLGIVQICVFHCDAPSQRYLMLEIVGPFVEATSHIFGSLGLKDIWLIGFFSSMIISLRPSIHIPRAECVLHRLCAGAVSLSCGSVNLIASEAVGCLVNKWQSNGVEMQVSNGISLSIAEALDLIIKGEWVSTALCNQTGTACLEPEKALVLKMGCIKLLGYAGKGLAIRGHIGVSDIAMLLLSLVHCKKILVDAKQKNLLQFLWPNDEERLSIASAAADALGFIAKDLGSSGWRQSHLVIKPLHQQRFFVSMLAPLELVLKESEEQERIILYYAFANLISSIPANVILMESKRVFPFVLESLSALSSAEMFSTSLSSVLLVLSAILVDKNGAELASRHLSAVVGRLQSLIQYQYSVTVRETSLLCLGTLVALPYARVFPFRTQVLKSLTNALDDPKRSVRKEAVRCRRAWELLTR